MLTRTLQLLMDYQRVRVFFWGGGSLGLASLGSLWFCTLLPSSFLPPKLLGISGSHLVIRLLGAAARTNAFVQGGLVRQFPPPMFHGSGSVRAVERYDVSYAHMIKIYVVKALKRRVGIDSAKIGERRECRSQRAMTTTPKRKNREEMQNTKHEQAGL